MTLINSIKVKLHYLYIVNHVLISMIKDGDGFTSLADFKDFLEAAREQNNNYKSKLN